jgi:hypothetical protein
MLLEYQKVLSARIEQINSIEDLSTDDNSLNEEGFDSESDQDSDFKETDSD